MPARGPQTYTILLTIYLSQLISSIKVNDAELLKSAISNNEILASIISPELISHIDHLNTTDQNRSGLIGIKSDSLMSSVVIPDAVNLNLPQNNSGGLAYKNVF